MGKLGSKTGGDHSSRRAKERDEKRERRRRIERKERERKERRRMRSKLSKKRRDYESESESESESGSEDQRANAGNVVMQMLKQFPQMGEDLRQLLQMVDNGQAVDINGISERSLIKCLKKLFISLHVMENGDGLFLLPANRSPTLEIVGGLIQDHISSQQQQSSTLTPSEDKHSVPPLAEHATKTYDDGPAIASKVDVVASTKRTIGPEMPSAELLAAAAKLTEAQAELREAEMEEDGELFIGPPPPSLVAEAESANEAERFEEVTRIMDVEGDSPYDVVGVNRNMSTDNVKKRYWKLSLLVHPDKCSHPLAHQAFVKLNKAFKELQDPDKRKLLDEKIQLQEEKEQFKAELKAMREAAQWRRLQGISMEGDDELLAEMEVKETQKRDEWMTTLPPERRPGGVTMQSTRFSKSTKEGRGDTSIWTDSPLDKAQKAKMNYLEAFNETAALAASEEEKKRTSADANLVDEYNKAKRSKSLMQKHQEEESSHSKSRKKLKNPPEKEDWVGKHPWKPWDREKDLVAGRQNIKFDADNMAQGLASRFSSGNFQRNFL